MEKNDNKNSFVVSSFLMTIWKRKVLFLVTLLLVMILGVVYTTFVFNPAQMQYTVTFNVSFHGIEKNEFPNGSYFDYDQIVDYNELQSVKDGNEEFSNIDIDSIVEKRDIYVEDKTVNNTVDKENDKKTYKITAKKEYFSSDKQAKSFLVAVVSSLTDKISEKIKSISYTNYLEIARYSTNNPIQYDSQLFLLVKQKEMLETEYTDLITDVGDKVVNGKKISVYESQFERYFANNDIELLVVLLEENGFARDSQEYSQQLSLEKAKYNRELAENEALRASIRAELATLASIYGSSATQGYEEFNTIIAESIERDNEIRIAIDVIDKKIDKLYTNEQLTSFDESIQRCFQALEGFSITYEDVIKGLYNEKTSVKYTNNNVIVTEGGINTILALALFFVFGSILSVMSVYLVEAFLHDKDKKKENLIS